MTTDVVIRRALHAVAAEAARLGAGGEPILERRGLCGNLRRATDWATDWGPLTLQSVLYRAFEAWPEFSGYADYPIPHADGEPMEAYDHCSLWEGEYGESRRRLCLHVAQYIERMIDNMYWDE